MVQHLPTISEMCSTDHAIELTITSAVIVLMALQVRPIVEVGLTCWTADNAFFGWTVFEYHIDLIQTVFSSMEILLTCLSVTLNNMFSHFLNFSKRGTAPFYRTDAEM